ncbi:MAG TPA: DNA translocase FtsK 4TM domain-containing protein [Thermoanaerobaculia bacterium]|jgi:S-DNA-T family DNA segregation ATPase FtsK/SpoIIIE
MSVAIVRRKSQTPERPTLSPEKGNELLGLVLLAAGVFLVLSLGSHHPQDPSLLHRVADEAVHPRNWIGAVGAHISAAAFGFFGLTCLLIPLFLVVAGWRRLRRRGARRVVGRGFGALLLLAATPGLLQIGFGRVSWSDGSVAAGGAFGVLLADLLEPRLNLMGTLVVLFAAVACGTALVVQSTLGDLLAVWRGRLRQLWQDWTLARARRRERREKEKNRRRVITKHLQRVAEEKQKMAPAPAEPHRPSMAAAAVSLGAPPPERIDLPLRPRVMERKGEAEFAIRRVNAAETEEADEDFPALPEPLPPAAGAPARTRRAPQKELPFVAEIAPGTLPPVNLLQMGDGRSAMDQAELVRLGEIIRNRCAEFGVEGTVEAISPGPVITVFEFQPAPGVKVSQIVNLQDDLALALKAEAVRIDRMPGRSTLGIEVPNKERAFIRLGSLLADERFKKFPSVLTVALGTDIHGEPYYADLSAMPHLLVAGATGAGKSVGLQSMITSILYKASRDEVQFIFIDPKRIELGVYADIPHLKCEVVVDPKKAANALRWAVAEMERRYRLLAEVHVRSIAYYNRAISDPETQKRLALSEAAEGAGGLFTPADLKPLPYYVVVIDELADLMMVASSEVETSIARLAQMARAVGIHLIVATQRPSVDVLTGTIKANFPCRISYATASRHDSRTILDQVGAEKLLGKGDMLMMPPGSSRIMRLHGAYISEQETAALIRWLKKLGRPELDPEVLRAPEGEGGATGDGGDNDDELYEEAARLVVAERQASASFLQRRMRIGFSRAARLIDMMEREGLLGPAQGSKPREVLVKPDYFEEIDVAGEGVEE